MTPRSLTTLCLAAILAGATGCVSVVAKTTDPLRGTNMLRERATLFNVHTDNGAIIRLYETGSSNNMPLRVLQVYSSTSAAQVYRPSRVAEPEFPDSSLSADPESTN